VIAQAGQDRDAMATRLSAATVTQAKSETEAITGGGEFGAVAFLASVVGVSADTAAKVVITTLSAIPDVGAALLLWAAGTQPAPVPARAAPPEPEPQQRKPQTRPRKQRPRLKVVKTAKQPAIPVEMLEALTRRYLRRQAKRQAMKQAIEQAIQVRGSSVLH